MLNKVSYTYVSEMLRKSRDLMQNAAGGEKFEVRKEIYIALYRIIADGFVGFGTEQIYTPLKVSYVERRDAIIAWVKLCLSVVPNKYSRCYRLMEEGVSQLMIGAVDR